MKKERSPSKLMTESEYYFTGSVADLITKLQQITAKHPKAYIDYKRDYSGCFYEGDTPGNEFTISSKQPRS